MVQYQAQGVTIYAGEGKVFSYRGKGKLDTLNRIWNNGEFGSVATSTFPLPSFAPPIDGLLALLSIPPRATLHVPITLTLTIRNHHPSKSANIAVQLDLDASDGFVIAGLRSGRVPILLPGTEEQLTWKMIPIECGHIKVPRIKVMELRRAVTVSDVEPETEGLESKGEVIKVIDVRFDHRPNPELDIGVEESSILVLP